MRTVEALEQAEEHYASLPLLGALGWAPILTVAEWVHAHLEDVASDLSVFHRVDDWQALPSAVYFERAARLSAYDGVIRRQLEAEAYEAEKEKADADERLRGPASAGRREPVQHVPFETQRDELVAAGFLEPRKTKEVPA